MDSLSIETKQQHFDLVLDAIVKQGRPSAANLAASRVACYYTHPQLPELHCAIGHLMTEKEQALVASNMVSISSLREYTRDMARFAPYFYTELQQAHDFAAQDNPEPDNFKRKFVANMRRVADIHGLDLSAVVKAEEEIHA